MKNIDELRKKEAAIKKILDSGVREKLMKIPGVTHVSVGLKIINNLETHNCASLQHNMNKFQNKYRIPSARLEGFDYGSNALYYITICTKDRIHYFGKIVETNNYASLQFTAIGNIAQQFWTEIPHHYPFVELDEFIIMPNHIHGILFFNKPEYNEWKPNEFGVQSKNLGAVIRGFKSTTKRLANDNLIDFEWQPRFHDHIIRNNQSLKNIREYIINNPAQWTNDEYNKTM